jgi:hypothetical protein
MSLAARQRGGFTSSDGLARDDTVRAVQYRHAARENVALLIVISPHTNRVGPKRFTT